MESGSAPPRSLRSIFVGGEALRPELLARTQRVLPRVDVWNLYGPTEATANATAERLAASAIEVERVVTIGRPVSGTQTYVLDDRFELVPIGVPGDLYLGGTGVARGYVGRPALTAERFVPDPFAERSGARLYRTGDLARYVPDGRLEFLGRTDGQVKVRGHRIELGEVESTLEASPGVRDAVVLVRRGGPGGDQLVAYVVLARDRHVSAVDLRRFAAERLPEYMRPAAYVFLDALPLTVHGKIDRAALTAQAPRSDTAERVTTGPRTVTEDIVAGIWMSLLGTDRLDIHESFFELGGHSLLATRVMTRIRQTFRVQLPLRTLFAGPTVAELAAAIDHASAADAAPPAPIAPASRGGPLPVSLAQQHLWLIDQIEPGTPLYNCSDALHLSGPLDVTALQRALTALVQRHEALRTTFDTIEGRPIQIVHAAPASHDLPLIDLSSLDERRREHEVQRLTDLDAHAPFDLRTGPLLRTKLLRLAAEEHILLVALHHIVFDGRSAVILVQELAALYESLIERKQPRLPPLPIQYADYAVWQHEFLSGTALHAHLAYWRDRLGGAPTVLDLPTDLARPAVQRYRGAQVEFDVLDAVTQGLRALSRREGATLFMTLLAAFGIVLGSRCGRRDFLIGTVVASRHRAEVDGLIGFFANQLALRIQLPAESSFREFLQRTRWHAFEAYAHDAVPFELVVKELQPVRDLTRSPLVQAELVLQDASALPVTAGRVRVSATGPRLQRLHGDLAITIIDQPSNVQGIAQYSADLFERSTILAMIDDFRTVLTGAATDPDSRLDAFFERLSIAEGERRDRRVQARVDADRDRLLQHAKSV
jgi:acyl carrier protein